MLSIGGTGGAGMLAAARRYRATVEASKGEEAEVVAPVVDRLLSASYDRRESPEGARWAPRVPPTGTWPLLEKTGDMRASQYVLAMPSGNVSMSYEGPAEYHQNGTPRMVARPLLPTTFPPAWEGPIGAARVDWWRSNLLGGGP